MAQEGGCLCNKIRIQYTGEPSFHALCHCLDCRKISGSSYSNNIVIPETNFKLLSGTPKTFDRKAASGKSITSHFCGDCGSTLFRNGDSFLGTVVIKVGVLDDPEWPNKNIAKAELFVGDRVKFLSEIPGAAQLPGMPPS